MKPKKSIQYGFFMLSMTAFFIVIAILGTKIPLCLKKESEFIGISKCLTSIGIIIPIICSFAFIYIGCFIHYLKRKMKGTLLGPIKIKEINSLNDDVIAFVGSYFLPLVSFNLVENWRHFVVLIILFVLIGVIYVKSNIYYTNPTLLALGYRVYKVEGTLQNGAVKCVVIIYGSLNENDEIMYIPIDDNTYYAKKL